jgi:hypothetical protein
VVADLLGGIVVPARDNRGPAATSPYQTPGVVIETIAVAMPFWSMTSSDWLGVQASIWLAGTL